MAKSKSPAQTRLLSYRGVMYISVDDVRSLLFESAQNRKGEQKKAFLAAGDLITETFLFAHRQHITIPDPPNTTLDGFPPGDPRSGL